MALSKTTQDHEEIKAWAERRGAVPGEVASTETAGETGILRIMFPHAPNHNDGALKEITWDEFFEKFDASGLSLVYQEVTVEGAESNFNKLVHPENAAPVKQASKRSAKKTSAKGATKAAAKKTTAKTTAAKAPAKKSPAGKTAGKAPGKKTSATKSAAKKAPAKKTVVKKTTKAAAKKSTAKKSTAKKTSRR